MIPGIHHKSVLITFIGAFILLLLLLLIVLQADRAAQIIWSAVRFRNSLFDNVLRPEVYHLNPAKSDKDWFNLLRYES